MFDIMSAKSGLALEGCICHMHRTNMYSITAVITLVLTLVASETFAQQTAPLRCYICVTDYEDGAQDPGCSTSSSNVIIRACAVQHGYDRCISYRARNTKTGNAVFRRHCATREMCEYQCLFSHHTNCQRSCCHGDLCNDVNFEGYEGSTGKPKTLRTTKVPITTQKPNATPTPKSDPTTESFGSTRNPIVTKKTTNSPFTTQKVLTTEEPLVGGPTRFGCRDYRDECPKYAKYHGYCQYTRDFMLIHCPWSCDFCAGGGTTKAPTKTPTRAKTTESATTTSVPDTTQSTQDARTTTKGNGGGLIGGPSEGCVDAREQCQPHADYDGYCSYHKGFMLTYCPKACGFCDEIQLPESPAKRATTENPSIITSKPELKTSEEHQRKPTPFGPGGEGFVTLPTRKKPTPFGPGGEDYERTGCIDLRENCSYYATTYDEYCNYNNFFMAIYCPFSCGFCGKTAPDGAFPHPPVVHQHASTYQDFPPPPSEKDARWLTSFCSECEHGYQECIPKCILLLKDGIYEPTSSDVCVKLLGEPKKIMPC